MTIIKSQRGIALVLVMVIALIALAIVSALIYMGTMATRLSGAEKIYRNSDEAALGGARIAADMIITNYGNSALGLPSVAATLGGSFGNQPCLIRKLNNATANWGGVCNADMKSMDLSSDNSDTYDMTFPLPGAPNNYTVYAKVIDTIEGNTSGVVVEGEGGLSTGGVGGGGASIVTPPRHSWMYRVEVHAEDSVNKRQRARYSIFYAH
jgi:hypothetical protein